MDSERALVEAIAEYDRTGRAAMADALAEDILKKSAFSVDGIFSISSDLYARRLYRYALTFLERAAELAPSRIDILGTLANCRAELGQVGAAIDCARNALAIDPSHSSLHFNLGNFLLRLGRVDAAIASYEEAIRLKASHAGAWHQLGCALLRQQRQARAQTCLETALRHSPDNAEYALTLATCYGAQGKWRMALDVLGDLRRTHPEDWRYDANFAATLVAVGAARQAEVYFLEALRKVREESAAQRLRSSYLLSLQYRDDVSIERLLGEHRDFPAPKPNDTTPHSPAIRGKRRIGYVSGDLCGHPVARFLLPVLAAHDRTRFEIFAYSNTPAEDSITGRIRSTVDGWRSITGLPAATTAERIRRDQIDVLIDLSGHTANNRLDVFGLRPAPVQLGWLGYPGPYRLPFIDARLTDSLVDPPEIPDVEPIHRLPGCMLAYRDEDIAHRPPRNTKRSANIVFCSFNSIAKLNDMTLALWADVLRAIPEAELLVKGKGATDHEVRDRIASSMGEVSGQVRLLDWEANQYAHLSRYHDVDIALDTFPYNGTTTTCEALSMGVPVVSLVGDRPAARMGLTILTAAGIPHLAAVDKAAYLRIARKLSHEISKGELPLQATAPVTIGDVATLTRSIETFIIN